MPRNAQIPIDRLPDQAIHHIPVGDLDALVANLGAPTQPPALNQLLTNDGHAFFADFTAASLTSRPSQAIALGDVDGDGDLDAVTANPNAPNQLLINDGTGHFTPTELTSFGGVDIALGDVNGDGNLDALFVTVGQGTQLQINDGNGGFNSLLLQIEFPDDAGAFDLSRTTCPATSATAPYTRSRESVPCRRPRLLPFHLGADRDRRGSRPTTDDRFSAPHRRLS